MQILYPLDNPFWSLHPMTRKYKKELSLCASDNITTQHVSCSQFWSHARNERENVGELKLHKKSISFQDINLNIRNLRIKYHQEC